MGRSSACGRRPTHGGGARHARRVDGEWQQVVLRSEWAALHLTDRQLKRAATDRGWDRVGRGAWNVPASRARPVTRPSKAGHAPDPAGVRAAAVAAALRHRRDVAVAGADAAAAWGLPRPLGSPAPVLLAASCGQRRTRSRTAVLVRPDLDPPVSVAGLGVRVTGVLTTLVDCALLLPGRDALAITDAAVRRGMVTREALQGATCASRRRGVRRARLVAALTDGRRETPLESWSAWAFHAEGLPAPRWQVEVVADDGLLVARVDCLWKTSAGRRLAGEADGRGKLALSDQGLTVAGVGRVVEAERQREADLRDLGVDMVRWSAADVLDPGRLAALVARIRRRLAG